MQTKTPLGYIGLGKMGSGMVARLLDAHWTVHVFDPDPAAVERMVAGGAHGASTLEQLILELKAPRTLWLMVPHSVVSSVLEDLVPLLTSGDTVIDGGNSNYKETLERSELLASHGIRFLDAGVSGGPGGARDGACVMVGGDTEDYQANEDLFRDISAPNSYSHVGATGAGHFVKMVHNGIEYGMMQAIGEGFDVLRHAPFPVDLKEVARIYNNRSVIESRLVGWLQSAYEKRGVDLDGVSSTVAHSGEGLWTVETARELGIPVDVIATSLSFRENSHKHPSYTGKVVSALRNEFGGHDVEEKKD